MVDVKFTIEASTKPARATTISSESGQNGSSLDLDLFFDCQNTVAIVSFQQNSVAQTVLYKWLDPR